MWQRRSIVLLKKKKKAYVLNRASFNICSDVPLVDSNIATCAVPLKMLYAQSYRARSYRDMKKKKIITERIERYCVLTKLVK